MKIAAIQMSAAADSGRSIERAVEMAAIAAEKGARIICYPELFLSPWFPREEDRSFFTLAQDVASETLERFRRVSESTKTVLIIPFFESSLGKYYNSAAVMDCGKVLGVYRKIHLPDLPHYRERFYFSSGNTGFPVFETTHGKIGIQICWDNLFPEGARILALKGAEIIFAPTAAALDTHNLWERAIAANAFANNAFIFRVNRVGREDQLSFYGRSCCINPWGETVSEIAGSKEAIVLADIDRSERDSAMETWGFLKHRRPDEYGELTNR
jgi:N-carbamoylputrescine amidase